MSEVGAARALAPLLDAFERSLQRDRRTPETILLYLSTVREYARYLADTHQTTVLDATEAMVRAWLEVLDACGAPRTLSRKFSTVHQFYRRLSLTDPTVGIEVAHHRLAKLRKGVPIEVATAARDRADMSDHLQVRDALVVCIAAELGMTSQRILELHLTDVGRLADRLDPNTGILLRYYADLMRPQSDSPRLFLSERRTPLSRQVLWKSFRRTVQLPISEVAYRARQRAAKPLRRPKGPSAPTSP